jgi:hypothetical protein
MKSKKSYIILGITDIIYFISTKYSPRIYKENSTESRSIVIEISMTRNSNLDKFI